MDIMVFNSELSVVYEGVLKICTESCEKKKI